MFFDGSPQQCSTVRSSAIYSDSLTHIEFVVESKLDVGNAGVLHEASRLVEGVHVAGFGQPEGRRVDFID